MKLRVSTGVSLNSQFHRLLASGTPPAQTELQGLELRNYEIIFRRSKGETLESIASHYGFTKEAIRQVIVRTYGPEIKDRIRESKNIVSESREGRILRAVSFILEHKGATVEEVLGPNRGLQEADLSRLPKKVRKYVQFPIRVRRVQIIWSDEDILKAIRKAATYHYPLAKDQYDALIRLGEMPGPSGPLIVKRFGTWSNACQAAEVESFAPNKHINKRWSELELAGFVRDFLLQENVGSSINEYNLWVTNHNTHAASSQLLRNTFGSWDQVLSTGLALLRNEWANVGGIS